MQAVTSKESAARRKAATVSASADELSMYNTPPQEEVTLEDFEQFAIDRLRGAGRFASTSVVNLLLLLQAEREHAELRECLLSLRF